jgi:hypothetical protein
MDEEPFIIAALMAKEENVVYRRKPLMKNCGLRT